MMQSRWGRWSRISSLWGVAFGLALLAGIVASGGETPNAGAGAAKVFSFFAAHRSEVETSNILILFAFLFALLWAGSLRTYLRRVPGAEGLATLALAGAALMAAGAGTVAGVEYGLAHQLYHLSPPALQTVNFLSNQLFLPIVMGAGVFIGATGLAIVRSALLPRWLGWLGLVIGILSLVPAVGFGALFAALFWSLVVSVLMYLRYDREPPVAASPSAA